MNKIIPLTGGHPLYYPDELVFTQAAVAEAIAGLGSILNTGNAILSGCQYAFDGVNWNISAGYCVISGEVYRVDASNLGGSAFATPVLVPTQVADFALSPVLYEDGGLKTVHFRRRAFLQDLAAQPTYISLTTTANYGDVWHEVGAAGEPAYTPGMVGVTGRKLNFRKVGRRIEFRGCTDGGGPTSVPLGQIFTLPVNYRPTSERRFPVYYKQNPGTAVTVLEILSTGAVRQVGAITDLTELSMDGVYFEMD